MFDTHPGDPPLIVHVITLCIGLIIAFGLRQIVVGWQRRRKRKREVAVAAKEIGHQEAGQPPFDGER
jgi:hypothetical protein